MYLAQAAMLSMLKTIVYGEAGAEAAQGTGLLPSAQPDGSPPLNYTKREKVHFPKRTQSTPYSIFPPF